MDIVVTSFQKALRQAALERQHIVPAPPPKPKPPSGRDNCLWINPFEGTVSKREQRGFLGYLCASPAERDALLQEFIKNHYWLVN